MARTTRRTILKLSGADAVAARTGGLAAILATGRAPAFCAGQDRANDEGNRGGQKWPSHHHVAGCYG
jgi:hypothetical protein